MREEVEVLAEAIQLRPAERVHEDDEHAPRCRAHGESLSKRGAKPIGVDRWTVAEAARPRQSRFGTPAGARPGRRPEMGRAPPRPARGYFRGTSAVVTAAAERNGVRRLTRSVALAIQCSVTKTTSPGASSTSPPLPDRRALKLAR